MDQEPEKQEDLWTTQQDIKSSQYLPPYDKALGTRQALLAGFFLSLALSITGLVIGIEAQIRSFRSRFWFYWEILPQVSGSAPGLSYSVKSKSFALLFTLTICICTECQGYIHSTSLRWALAKEGRLEFNSNLRLFSSARSSVGNGRIANLLSTLSLVLCYAGASCTLLESIGINGNRTGTIVVLSQVGVIGASAGLFGLCAITGIGWYMGERSGTIKSWNPHPLNTALVCLHHKLLFRNVGRATLDVSQRHKIYDSPRMLVDSQPSALKAIPKLRYINYLAIAIACVISSLACALMIVLWKLRFPLPETTDGRTFVWLFFPAELSSDMIAFTNLLGIYLYGNVPIFLVIYLRLLWSFLWQSISTINFHILELLVNIRRDENCWRKLVGTDGEGATFSQNAFRAVLSNKGSIMLFCLKLVGQWIYTLAFYNTGSGAGVNPLPLCVLSAIMSLLALVTVLTSRNQPRGALPCSYGHLQTIVDNVDDWGQGVQGQLYWGDKGVITMDYGNGTASYRRAGTSGDKKCVDKVMSHKEYSIY